MGAPPQATAPLFPLPNLTPSFDGAQDALGPAWQQLQSYFYSSRGGSPGGGEEEDKKNERCRKEWEDAIEACAKPYQDYSRHVTGPFGSKIPWGSWDCARGLVTEDCDGNPVDYGKQGRPRR